MPCLIKWNLHSYKGHRSPLRLPALKGEQFCYFHQNAIRSVRRPRQSRLHPIALIEDEESIQYALMEVINALMKNTIDLKRATSILSALHIAVKNDSRVKFEVQGMNSVRQIPEYAPPPDNTDPSETAEIDLPYNAWVPKSPNARSWKRNTLPGNYRNGKTNKPPSAPTWSAPKSLRARRNQPMGRSSPRRTLPTPPRPMWGQPV